MPLWSLKSASIQPIFYHFESHAQCRILTILLYVDPLQIQTESANVLHLRFYTLYWVLNVSAKCLHFRFEFAEGQNTKIHAKYQNSFQAQNAKISAVSTPILTAKAAFFRIFRALSEKSVENG